MVLEGGGFTDIEYTTTVTILEDVVAGKLDFAGREIMGLLLALEAGAPKPSSLSP